MERERLEIVTAIAQERQAQENMGGKRSVYLLSDGIAALASSNSVNIHHVQCLRDGFYQRRTARILSNHARASRNGYAATDWHQLDHVNCLVHDSHLPTDDCQILRPVHFHRKCRLLSTSLQPRVRVSEFILLLIYPDPNLYHRSYRSSASPTRRTCWDGNRYVHPRRLHFCCSFCARNRRYYCALLVRLLVRCRLDSGTLAPDSRVCTASDSVAIRSFIDVCNMDIYVPRG